MPVPDTLNVRLLPSLTLDAAGVMLYVAPGAGVVLVSLIVTELLVATTVPLVLPVRTDTVNVSAPSVVASAVGVTLNDPALPVIVNDPDDAAVNDALKSPLLDTVQ